MPKVQIRSALRDRPFDGTSGRLGTLNEVADVAVFPRSPRSFRVAGECVSVDGGQHHGVRYRLESGLDARSHRPVDSLLVQQQDQIVQPAPRPGWFARSERVPPAVTRFDPAAIHHRPAEAAGEHGGA